MMQIYWGRRGAGKTNGAVDVGVRRWSKGCDVITNIHINVEALPKTNRPGRIFKIDDPEDIKYFRGTKKRRAIFIFDEAYLKFNSRNWKDLPPETHELMAQSRKIKVDVIIIAQGYRRIDIVMREIADEFVRFEKTFFGLGYLEIHQEIDPETDQLVPTGSAAMESDGKKKLKFYHSKNFAVYDTDQLYGSLLEKLEPKKFKEIVTGEEIELPEKKKTESEPPSSGTAVPPVKELVKGISAERSEATI